MSSLIEGHPTTSAYCREPPGSFPEEPDDGPQDLIACDLSSLSQAVRARKAEYIRERTVCVKVGTWNVASIPGTEQDVGTWFVDGKAQALQEGGGEQWEEFQPAGLKDVERSNPEDVGIYVLGLQEIVDVSSPAETFRPYVDPGPSNRWKVAVQKALPPGYQLIADSQLVGLLLLVYAAPSIAPTISSIKTTSVGTGLMGYMGNKGAVISRIVLGETTSLVFINCHLAAGADRSSLERRNWDAAQIISRTKFDPIDLEDLLCEDPTDIIGGEDFAFWFGDLNYRLDDIPGDDVRRLLTLHTRNEYDMAGQLDAKIDKDLPSPHLGPQDDDRPSPPVPINQVSSPYSTGGPSRLADDDVDPYSDPASLQTTLTSLLSHDQLRGQQKQGRSFHEGWREGEIHFLPTYKYDIGSIAMFDSSEKQRGPSWCDRILYRSKQDRANYEQRERNAAEARKRDEEMKARGLEKAVDDDSILFDYDPDVDAANEFEDYDETDDFTGNPAPTQVQEFFHEPLQLTHYSSHQRIVSSDHKPLDAEFTLSYKAVIPELKARVHQEVVRHLDREENETRPSLTVVIDHQGYDSGATSSGNVIADANAVDFGDVPFDVLIHRGLTLANTGRISACFSLSPRPFVGGDKRPSWLRIRVDWPASNRNRNDKSEGSSDEYDLAPGDSVNVELTTCIQDIDHVRSLNTGEAKIEEIVVLRVKNGRDHFIPVYGKWLPTCFGRTLEELTRIPEDGARSLRTVASPGFKDRLSAPRELFKLTEAISDLTERAVAEWSMIKGADEGLPPWVSEPHGPGWPFKPETWTLRDRAERELFLSSVREALDTGNSLNSAFPPETHSLHRLEILSETIIAFLHSLQDGVIPTLVWLDMEQQLVAWEKSKSFPLSTEEFQNWIVDSLVFSPVHSVSFTFLTFMLARITNEIATISNTPSTPAPALLPATPTTSESRNPPESFSPVLSSSSFISSGNLQRRKRTLTSSSIDNSLGWLRRQEVEFTLASILADAMISSSSPPPTKEKERRTSEDRKRSIIQPFLRSPSGATHA
ncbi:hypothetical protein Egran_05293 [Elaphomyces granulatus]|uniref:Inositol polyphosphate-related phosphatase domain-containing protein n=1 Tax=Elaphomyces granulatus TaxID=519963 RepID=A0A232LS00_9EURO|nr:hypothetical protein Egran_05293 [Elaphomyces granulatus]